MLNKSVDLPSKIHHKKTNQASEECDDEQLAAEITKIPQAQMDSKKSFLSNGEIDNIVGRDSRISSSHNSYQFLPSNQQISFAATNSNSKKGGTSDHNLIPPSGNERKTINASPLSN